MPKSLLPYSMQDDSNLAIEECINNALSMDMSKFLLYMPENLSDPILYELAKMFHVLGIEGWSKCKTRDDKITLLKTAIKNHRFKGSVYSIKSSLPNKDLLYLKWNEYGGIPNHFKIRLFLEEEITIKSISEILQTTEEYKRLSAKLDGLEIITRPKTELKLATTILQSRKILITQ